LKKCPRLRICCCVTKPKTARSKQKSSTWFVLSVGLDHVKNVEELSGKLGIEINEYGFAQTEAFDPVETSRKGIFVCGAPAGPKDIPKPSRRHQSGKQGRWPASRGRGTLVTEKVYPPEIPVDNAGGLASLSATVASTLAAWYA
jgi:hypothetical protein